MSDVELTISGRAKEPPSVRLIATLALAGLLSGLALAGVYEVTRPVIEANQKRALERAVFEVVPGATRMRRLERRDGAIVAVPDGEESGAPAIHAAYADDGRFLGYAIEGEGPGYQDTIRLLLGYEPRAARVIGMYVLESRETPGLGDKIFKDADFVANFAALAVEPRIVLVKGEAAGENEVDAITGATISSRAVVSILNDALATWRPVLPPPGAEPAPPPAPGEVGGTWGGTRAGRREGRAMAEPVDAARISAELAKGIWKENPVFIQVLGMCPMLAVTNSAVNAIAMGAATAFVLIGSSLLVSLLRSFIPRQVRITTYIIIIATFVTVADLSLQALVPDIHRELGAFISLIVVNCLILGRQEAFASRHPTRLALADAVGMAIGFAIALLCLGGAREILGAGELFGRPLFGEHFEPWVIMLLPPGGFFMLGFILLFINWVQRPRATGAPAAREEARR